LGLDSSRGQDVLFDQLVQLGLAQPGTPCRSHRERAGAAQQPSCDVLEVVGAPPAQDAKRLPGLVAEHDPILVAAVPVRRGIARWSSAAVLVPFAGCRAGRQWLVDERSHGELTGVGVDHGRNPQWHGHRIR
jgi:hypothetical protein